MPIPDYQTLMLPLLKLASDGEERKFREAIEALATEFELSGDERAEPNVRPTYRPTSTYPLHKPHLPIAC